MNNWEQLQLNPFNDIQKSNDYYENTKLCLSRNSINANYIFEKVINKYSSLKRPPQIQALSELIYIGFRRTGLPTYKELEFHITKFKDDNNLYLSKFKEILIDYELEKKEYKNTFNNISQKQKLENTCEYNKLIVNFINLINSKITKIDLEPLNDPISVYEYNKRDNFTITSNKEKLNEIYNSLDKNKLGLSIDHKYFNKDLAADSFNGLCNATSSNCIHELRRIGIDPYPYAVWLIAHSPVEDKFYITHYVCLVQINNILYLFDMPQCEFVSKSISIKKGFRYIQDFNPRFIELNIENLNKFYSDSDISIKNLKNVMETKINSYSVNDYIQDTKI